MTTNINDNDDDDNTKNKGKFLFSEIPSGLRKTLYSLQPGRPQFQLLWRISSHAGINARRLFEYINSNNNVRLNNADIRPSKALIPLTQLLQQAVFL